MQSAESGKNQDYEDELSGLIDKEWELEMHGAIYIVNLSVKAQVMTLDVESEGNCDRWSNDFPAKYIEEITQKAGNFKKFGVFVKMLASAFSKESESVYADILTYSDLEMLKARKLGSSGSENRPSNNKSHLKRYIILTYAGEFDRVHFPLPLTFQDDSNVESLKRSIQRLRRRLGENKSEPVEGFLDKNRENKLIISQLRQENTELRHRLRQCETRLSKINPSATTGTVELVNANSKLRKQNEKLKKDLADLTVSHERYRLEASKELAKWKNRASSSNQVKLDDKRVFSVGEPNDERVKDDTIRILKRRIIELEKNLFFERQHKGQPALGSRSSSPSARAHSPTLASSRSRNSSPIIASEARRQAFLNRTQNDSVKASYRQRTPSPSQDSKLIGSNSRVRSATLPNSKSNPSKFPGVSRNQNRESGYSSQSSIGSKSSIRSNLSRKSNRVYSSDESEAASLEPKTTRRKQVSSKTSELKQLGVADTSRNAQLSSSKKKLDILREIKQRRDDVGTPSSSTSDKTSHRYSSSERPYSSSALKQSNNEVSHQPKRSIEESLKTLSESIDKSDSTLRASRDSGLAKVTTPLRSSGNDLSDIDKRIQALQSFLDTARSGIMSNN